MEWLLVFFGWVFIAAMFAAILVPYLRGKGDLLTTWNLFLLGSANYVGLAAVQTGAVRRDFEVYLDSDYVRFATGAFVFYTVGLLTYHFFKYPDRAAGRRLRKWPPVASNILITLIPVFFVLALG